MELKGLALDGVETRIKDATAKIEQMGKVQEELDLARKVSFFAPLFTKPHNPTPCSICGIMKWNWTWGSICLKLAGLALTFLFFFSSFVFSCSCSSSAVFQLAVREHQAEPVDSENPVNATPGPERRRRLPDVSGQRHPNVRVALVHLRPLPGPQRAVSVMTLSPKSPICYVIWLLSC